MVVFLLSAGYLVAKGGIAVKQKLETRKHPTRDGDFIELPISLHGSKRNKKRPSLTQSLQEQWARLSLSGKQLQQQSSSSQFQHEFQQVSDYYQCGQEVVLQNMQDAALNGRKAEVIFDTGSRGVLIRLEGDDFDMGTLLLPENLQPVTIHPSTTSTATSDNSDNFEISVGMLIELQHLQSPAHCGKNGRRCAVVNLGNVNHNGYISAQDCSSSSQARITVKLLNDKDDNSSNCSNSNNCNDNDILFRVKPINCKVVKG